MEFKQITVDLHSSGKVIMTPVDLYQISNHNIKYVIIYNLVFIDINPDIPIMESKIPYYISDGNTNKLRANMLFPFLCYSNMYDVKNCPYDNDLLLKRMPEKSLILKYKSFQNLDINKLEENLLHTFFTIYPTESTTMREKISDKKNKGIGLTSVLVRITNLVDFLVCITNNVISNFDYKQSKIDVDLGKYRPFSQEQIKQGLDYTDMSIFGKEPCSPFSNHFRLVILTILNRYYKLFINIISIKTINLDLQKITVEMLNIITDICDKEDKKTNMNNYKMISNKMVSIVNQKIDIVDNISIEDKSNLKSIIILSTETHVNDYEIYNSQLNKWNVNCMNKHLTYNTTNIDSMNFKEICQELETYSELIKSVRPDLIPFIHKNCANLSSEELFKQTKIFLLEMRNNFVEFNYIGQITIHIKNSETDKVEKTIIIDIDTKDTISTLKSKISSIIGIEPSRLNIYKYSGPALAKYIEITDDTTIASHQLSRKQNLILYIDHKI